MNLPYIYLSQPRLDPDVLGSVLEVVWDKVDEETQKQIINILEDNNIKYEK